MCYFCCFSFLACLFRTVEQFLNSKIKSYALCHHHFNELFSCHMLFMASYLAIYLICINLTNPHTNHKHLCIFHLAFLSKFNVTLEKP